jgi:LmbE family N-acetylglucosaminyl deacetylase
MITPGLLRRATPLALLAALLTAPVAAQTARTEYEGSAALGLALRQLGVAKRVLMIAAHPDDESTQVLATLALAQGAEVAYLSLNRGEGGQNGIGPELQEALGLIRSEELLAARRLDGARQYFTRSFDYGFSKSAEEAFTQWPRDTLLGDVVAVVREFRPDVILTVWGGTPRDGHGQHQAAGILAQDAFDAAADPGRFPEQVARGLRPHAAVRLYQSSWRAGADDPGPRLRAGELDPLLGRSYFQAAMASRSRHRSQDMGSLLVPGPQTSVLRLMKSRVPEGPDHASIFAGLDTTIAAHAAGAAALASRAGAGSTLAALLADYEERVARARDRFNPLAPAALVPELAGAVALLARARAEPMPASQPELAFRIAAEHEKATQALWLAAGLVLDAIAEEETVVPGQEFQLALTLWNGGSAPVDVRSLEPRLPAGWRAEPLDALPGTLAPSTIATRRFRVRVPADASLTEPYYLRLPREGAMYRWPAEHGPVGYPFEAPEVAATATAVVAGVELGSEVEGTFRGLDKMVGEFRRPVRVVPAVALMLEPALAILPLGRRGAGAEPLRFAVRLRGNAPAGIAGTLRAQAPSGWRVEPASLPLTFSAAGEERTVELRVSPPAGVAAGEFPVSFAFEAADGRSYRRGYSLVDYPHIRPRSLYAPAEARVQAFDVQVPTNLRVGYVAGPGDDVPAALEQMGVRVEMLGPAALATAELGGFDVIVMGIRAYEVRPDLAVHNQRLLDYTRRGGTLIVQYNKYEYTEPGVAPFPVEIARPHGRITDEAAPVRILDPAHPLFTTPNRITAADFDGWVQERGLYFLSRWDERYLPLLEMADPGEDPQRGGLVIARYGEGTYVYTGLAFFRQMPAGVPGAYRLFANLLALGAR